MTHWSVPIAIGWEGWIRSQLITRPRLSIESSIPSVHQEGVLAPNMAKYKHVVASNVSDKRHVPDVKISSVSYIYMLPFLSKHCYHSSGCRAPWKISLLLCFRWGPGLYLLQGLCRPSPQHYLFMDNCDIFLTYCQHAKSRSKAWNYNGP